MKCLESPYLNSSEILGSTLLFNSLHSEDARLLTFVGDPVPTLKGCCESR